MDAHLLRYLYLYLYLYRGSLLFFIAVDVVAAAFFSFIQFSFGTTSHIEHLTKAMAKQKMLCVCVCEAVWSTFLVTYIGRLVYFSCYLYMMAMSNNK
jgi:hypothetical protein